MTTEELIKEFEDWASLDDRLIDNPSLEWLESHRILHQVSTRLRELHAENQRLREFISLLRETAEDINNTQDGRRLSSSWWEAEARRVLGEEGGER